MFIWGVIGTFYGHSEISKVVGVGGGADSCYWVSNEALCFLFVLEKGDGLCVFVASSSRE